MTRDIRPLTPERDAIISHVATYPEGMAHDSSLQSILSVVAKDASLQSVLTALADIAKDSSAQAILSALSGVSKDATLASILTQLQTLTAIYSASTSTITASASITTTPSVKIIAANASRKGLYLYNNSANTVYIALGSLSNSSNNMTVPIATFTTWAMPQPSYKGDIYGIRNSGSGTVLATELT